MNDGNLRDLTTREPREHKEISSKGGTNSGKARNKKKEEKKQRKELAEAFADIGYSEIKLPEIKRMLKKLGIEGNDYFTALFAAALVKAIKKGDMKAVATVFELLKKGNNSHENPEEEKSFQNLIGAIKDV